MGTLYGESIDTLDPNFGRLTDDARILAQWVELALQTPHGSDWTAPEAFIDLRSYVAKGLTEEAFAAIPGDVEAALTFDERIARVDVVATSTFLASGAAALKLAITVYPKDASALPFQLVGTVTADFVSITTRGL